MVWNVAETAGLGQPGKSEATDRGLLAINACYAVLPVLASLYLSPLTWL